MENIIVCCNNFYVSQNIYIFGINVVNLFLKSPKVYRCYYRDWYREVNVLKIYFHPLIFSLCYTSGILCIMRDSLLNTSRPYKSRRLPKARANCNDGMLLVIYIAVYSAATNSRRFFSVGDLLERYIRISTNLVEQEESIHTVAMWCTVYNWKHWCRTLFPHKEISHVIYQFYFEINNE